MKQFYVSASRLTHDILPQIPGIDPERWAQWNSIYILLLSSASSIFSEHVAGSDRLFEFLQVIPTSHFRIPCVEFAMNIVRSLRENNFFRFFRLLEVSPTEEQKIFITVSGLLSLATSILFVLQCSPSSRSSLSVSLISLEFLSLESLSLILLKYSFG